MGGLGNPKDTPRSLGVGGNRKVLRSFVGYRRYPEVSWGLEDSLREVGKLMGLWKS